MNIAKLILLACPVFLASILLIANPAYALNAKSTSATQQITELVTPNLAQVSNPITEQLGCNCANCIQVKLQSLQGKLPSVDFR